AVVALPLVLPPTVLGFYLLLAIAPHGWLGAPYARVTGKSLAFSFTALVVGSVLYSLPFAVQPFAAGFAAVSPELMASSRLLGAGRLRTFWRIIVPIAAPSLMTGATLAF